MDVCCIGGLTEAKKVAGWCEAHYIDLMPHNPIGPVCTAATVHLAAAINNCSWLRVVPTFTEGADGGTLIGKPVKLHFRMRSAKLFAFQFVKLE